MIDKYIHLSLDAALEVLSQWASDSTKLRLTAASALAGVSFVGSVTVVKDPSAFSTLFACGREGELRTSLFDAEWLRVSAEKPYRWLVFDKPGDFRFVLEVEGEEPLDEINFDDFDLVSTETQ